MSKIPTVNFMRVTSQDDGVNGGEVYVFHHEIDDVLRGIAEDFERGKLSPRQARRRLLARRFSSASQRRRPWIPTSKKH
jgi:hypothetical protein